MQSDKAGLCMQLTSKVVPSSLQRFIGRSILPSGEQDRVRFG